MSQDLVKGQNWLALTGTGKNRVETVGTQTHRLTTSLIHLHLEAYLRHWSQAGEEKMKNFLLVSWGQSRAHGHVPSLLSWCTSPRGTLTCFIVSAFKKDGLLSLYFCLFLTIMPLPLGKRRKYCLLA